MVRQTQLPLAEFTTYFVDRCLGPKTFAAPLRDLGFRVEHLNDHFSPDARDEHWIVEVTGRSWIIISADLRIRHRAPEIEAFRDCGARMLLLGQKLAVNDRLDLFLAAKSRIEAAIRTQSAPWMARIVGEPPKSPYGKLKAHLQFLDL